jgi:membrane fusion protein (multidrug efflux system)
MKKNRLCPAFILLTTLALAGCGKQEQAHAPPPPPPTSTTTPPPVVLVTEATEANVPDLGETIATLEGSTSTPIRAQVTGYLIKQDYSEGAVVKPGDLLFQIDPRPFQAALDKASADLATAQGNLAAAQAAVAEAQANLAHTRITSPVEGIAGKAQPGVGDLISPGTELTTVSTVDPILAGFNVTEPFYLNHAGLIAKMSALPLADRPDNIELVLDGGTVYPIKGKFSYCVVTSAGTSARSIGIYALFPNPDHVLRPGQYARVRVEWQDIGAVSIPQRAVNQMQSLNQVDVIKPDNTVEVRNVTLGDRDGSNLIVTDGLKPGERVVVEGIQKCQAGATVKPQPWAPDTPDVPVPTTNSAPVTPNKP